MTYSNKSSWGRLWLTLFFTLNESLHNPQFWESGVAQNISTAQSPLSCCESASEIFITVSGLSQGNDSINTSLWYLCRVSIYLFIYLLLYLAPWLGPGCLCLGRRGNRKMTAASDKRDSDWDLNLKNIATLTCTADSLSLLLLTSWGNIKFDF